MYVYVSYLFCFYEELRKRQTEIEIYFKELAFVIMGKSEICILAE